MTSIASRNSVLAIVPEVTQNLLRLPQSASDYVPLQSDFAIEAAFDEIENEEITASIGRAAPIQGGENPTSSLSFYLKGSGVEGTKPQWSDIAKSFFGSETTEGTQRSTTTSSTTSIIKVTGASSLFVQGYGLLIKDPVNGYRVRVVHSVDTNDVTPSFDLPAAPGSGVGLGKPVFWSPANSGHQSLSVWQYAGNGGAVQAVAGAMVSDFSFSVTANEAINASCSLEGLSYFFDPIYIASTDAYFDWTDDDGTFAAAVEVGWYKDPHELAEALTAAIAATATTETIVCEYNDSTGKFSISTSTSTVLTLEWNTGANTANTIAEALGFSAAADDSGATSYIADDVQDFSAPHTPSYDATQPLVAKNQEVMIGEQDEYACFNASSVEVSCTNTRRVIESICAESGRSGALINEREVEISVTALLNQYDAKQMARFRKGDTIRFQFTGGNKSGGNWVAGTVCYAYGPQCKIAAISITDDDGLISLNMTLRPFVPATGGGEFYVGQL